MTKPQSEKPQDMTVQEKYETVLNFCTNCDNGRGIWKRIDENRELLQFLQKQAPDVIEKFSFIETWIAQQDIFLVVLEQILQLEKDPGFKNSRFPRPWTGEDALEKAYQEFFELYAPTLLINHSDSDGDT